MRAPVVAALLTCLTLPAGVGHAAGAVTPITANASAAAASVASPVSAPALRGDRVPVTSGRVVSGQGPTARPLAGIRVRVFAAGPQRARLLAATRSGGNGRFQVALPPTGANAVRYAVADRGTTRLLAVLPTGRRFVINELTTVATAYAFRQFLRAAGISGPQLRLRTARGMMRHLVTGTGTTGALLRRSPNGHQTNTWRATNTLANAVGECVAGTCGPLFAAARLAPRSPRANTLTAIRRIAAHPASNVTAVWRAADPGLYRPALRRPPDAWTLALKFNRSGSSSCPFGGPGNIAFDPRGYAWISNNVVQGTPDSTNCMIVLRPDGLPADGRGDAPDSPVFGGGILGAGFGMHVSGDQVWLGNFGWGSVLPAAGSISTFDLSGEATSPAAGYSDGLYRVQGIASDRHGNVWAASYGNQQIVVYLAGDINRPVIFSTGTSDPFDIEAGRGTDMWVSYSNSAQVAKLRLVDGAVELVGTADVGKQPKGFAVDVQGNAWVSTISEAAVYRVSRDLQSVTTHAGGGIAGTWGAAVDAANHVWLANFVPGPSGDYSIAELCGGGHCGRVGRPLSPDSGYTLPSAGAQVRLANGDPLYGPGARPSFKPLMRQTTVKIDSAGNLWVTNNWKPSALADTRNPGGDGIVVFLGMGSVA